MATTQGDEEDQPDFTPESLEEVVEEAKRRQPQPGEVAAQEGEAEAARQDSNDSESLAKVQEELAFHMALVEHLQSSMGISAHQALQFRSAAGDIGEFSRLTGMAEAFRAVNVTILNARITRQVPNIPVPMGT